MFSRSRHIASCFCWSVPSFCPAAFPTGNSEDLQLEEWTAQQGTAAVPAANDTLSRELKQLKDAIDFYYGRDGTLRGETLRRSPGEISDPDGPTLPDKPRAAGSFRKKIAEIGNLARNNYQNTVKSVERVQDLRGRIRS